MHRTFKMRAAQRGVSLSEYLLAELRPIAELPTTEELVQRIRSKELYDVDPAAIIRRDRNTR
jgi:hypothetical protein